MNSPTASEVAEATRENYERLAQTAARELALERLLFNTRGTYVCYRGPHAWFSMLVRVGKSPVVAQGETMASALDKLIRTFRP